MRDCWHWVRTSNYTPILLMIVWLILIILNFRTLWDDPLAGAKYIQKHPVIKSKLNSLDSIKKDIKKPVFGLYVPSTAKEITLSSLDLKIIGVVVAERPEDSHALVELANGEQKLYSIDNTLPGNAVIKKICKDGLLIWYNNRLERLRLPGDELEFSPQDAPLREALS